MLHFKPLKIQDDDDGSHSRAEEIKVAPPTHQQGYIERIFDINENDHQVNERVEEQTEDEPLVDHQRTRRMRHLTQGCSADDQQRSTEIVAPRKRQRAIRNREQQVALMEVPVDPGQESPAGEGSGLRRSTRNRIKPLAFWKNERLVFGRNESSPGSLPGIKAVIRATDPKSLQREAIVEPKNYLKFHDDPGNQYQLHRGLENDSISSGIIRIPGHGQKPNQNAIFSSMVFYVVKGRVRVTIHKNSFEIGPGDRFMVPRGNQYMIENLSVKECTLFFGQNKFEEQEGITPNDFEAYTEAMIPSALGSASSSASSSASELVSISNAKSATLQSYRSHQIPTAEHVRRFRRLTKTTPTPSTQHTSYKGQKVEPEDRHNGDDLFNLSMQEDDNEDVEDN
ncbi:Centromere protein C [Modicella reniformis]|uniref:CENP-C homolog n=1 Tax=Modicella reniformis TaxID=1440133 RepID=A0A9P6MBM2_9FUNG|nr:Centromere protein C [Modicella reniformis]